MKTTMAAILLAILSACASTPEDDYVNIWWSVWQEDYSTGELAYVFRSTVNMDCASYWASEVIDEMGQTDNAAVYYTRVVYNHCIDHTASGYTQHYPPANPLDFHMIGNQPVNVRIQQW